MDVLAANRLGYALYTDFEGRPHRERNFARFVFLDEAARTLYVDWELIAGNCVAALRLYAGRHPDDPQLTELIGELSLHSETFRRMWATTTSSPTPPAPNASTTPSSATSLDYVVLAVEGDPEQTLVVYTPEPASPPPKPSTCSPAGPAPPPPGHMPQTDTQPSRRRGAALAAHN